MLLEPAPSSSRSVNSSLERRTLSICSSTKNLEQTQPTEEEGSEAAGFQTVRRMPTKGKGSASSSTISLHSKKSKGKKGPLSRQGSGPLHEGCFITTPKRMVTSHIVAPEGDEPRSAKHRDSTAASKREEPAARKSGEEKKEEEEEKRSMCEEDKGRSVLNQQLLQQLEKQTASQGVGQISTIVPASSAVSSQYATVMSTAPTASSIANKLSAKRGVSKLFPFKEQKILFRMNRKERICRSKATLKIFDVQSGTLSEQDSLISQPSQRSKKQNTTPKKRRASDTGELR